MKTKAFLLVPIIASLCVSNVSVAGPAAESLGTCMVDSMTGKERKQIAQWLFFAIAAHPEMKAFSRVTADAQRSSNEFVGKLLTRLLTEDCPDQTKMAVKEDGDEAIKQAFGLVGKIAMQELMTNKDVTASISGFQQYVDKEKFNAVFPRK